MTPPINIDGSQVSGVTIDGTDVTEVTVDGTTVFTAILGSVDNRLKMDEGSGSTLNDDIGSLTATFQGTWTTASRFTGGAATQYDATDDFWTADSNININGQDWGVGFWVADIDNSNAFGGLMSAYPEGQRNSNGWTVFLGSTSGDNNRTDILTVRHRNGGSNSDAIADQSIPDLADGDDYFIGLSGSGDTTNLYIWDGSQQLTNTSGTASRGQTTDAPLTGMDRAGTKCGGKQDDVFTAQGAAPSEADWKTIYEETKR